MGKDYMHSQLESGSYHLAALEEELLQSDREPLIGEVNETGNCCYRQN